MPASLFSRGSLAVLTKHLLPQPFPSGGGLQISVMLLAVEHGCVIRATAGWIFALSSLHAG